jgi:hypothetical protein
MSCCTFTRPALVPSSPNDHCFQPSNVVACSIDAAFVGGCMGVIDVWSSVFCYLVLFGAVEQ